MLCDGLVCLDLLCFFCCFDICPKCDTLDVIWFCPNICERFFRFISNS